MAQPWYLRSSHPILQCIYIYTVLYLQLLPQPSSTWDFESCNWIFVSLSQLPPVSEVLKFKAALWVRIKYIGSASGCIGNLNIKRT